MVHAIWHEATASCHMVSIHVLNYCLSDGRLLPVCAMDIVEWSLLLA